MLKFWLFAQEISDLQKVTSEDPGDFFMTRQKAQYVKNNYATKFMVQYQLWHKLYLNFKFLSWIKKKFSKNNKNLMLQNGEFSAHFHLLANFCLKQSHILAMFIFGNKIC